MAGTTQACLFRDAYSSLTSTGFSIYGLSSDSPKSNTTFKTKQNLPYTLLCDPSVTLIAAIGMKKAPKGTIRGVFIVDKDGKVLAAEAGVSHDKFYTTFCMDIQAEAQHRGRRQHSRWSRSLLDPRLTLLPREWMKTRAMWLKVRK